MLADRHLVGRLRCRADLLLGPLLDRCHRLVHRRDGLVQERSRAVDGLHRLGSHESPARTAPAAVRSGGGCRRGGIGAQLLVWDDDLAGETCLEEAQGAEVLAQHKLHQRLADQDHDGVGAEVPLVVDRRLVARPGDERVNSGRRLEPQCEHPATERQHEDDPERQDGPARSGPGDTLEPLPHAHAQGRLPAAAPADAGRGGCGRGVGIAPGRLRAKRIGARSDVHVNPS